ncbi:putative C-S lyase [Salipaludibacillus agaradhaerens]|uniref:cysteine-S-conjugate beta-lyase n=1 Tax=Salipaludibacillus agaradhaerens TaxID=76935 RepID=A0A9Q4FYQ3_SALAG|nr:PatB family C-S lyase [Salipaludibacillus agaradhaerens]MCR6097920.1 putative C-S lyase [Salipaludibacillus agaradhaerens]MCR6116451.1 putative C-S lyase [Salipaludibacillus agaradhaerens]
MDFFEQNIDRTGTFSVKWERTKEVFKTEEDVLPMWVADMDFRPPQAISDALKKRVEHGIFGYTFTGETVADAIINWLADRHGWEINKSWITYSPGVVPSIGKAIQAFTEPGDRILVQSPVYPPFFSMITDNDRKVENCPLIKKEHQYDIDFDAFEQALKNGVKLFILCSPHNPVGRVWTEDELRRMAELCLAHDVIIVSDEIHSDLILAGHQHVPIASLSKEIAENTITLIAPSKTFNLAGLQASVIICANHDLQKKLNVIAKRQGSFTLNTFGIVAMEAAYRYGEEWLDELLAYLKGNVDVVKSYIADELPELTLVEPEGTYLLWIDCRKLGLSDGELNHLFTHKGKIGFNPGISFGKGGEGFVRMNVACPRSTVIEGLARMKKAIHS